MVVVIVVVLCVMGVVWFGCGWVVVVVLCVVLLFGYVDV